MRDLIPFPTPKRRSVLSAVLLSIRGMFVWRICMIPLYSVVRQHGAGNMRFLLYRDTYIFGIRIARWSKT